MTGLHAESTSTDESSPSFREMFETKDISRIAELYFLFADTLGGVIRLAPLHKRGGVDWNAKRLRGGEYIKPAHDDVPETFAEVERWFVLVDYVDGCAEESRFAVFLAPHLGRGEAPVVWQLSGPPGDEQVGRSIIFRDLGLGDILEWQVSVYGMPTAANDNAPQDVRDYSTAGELKPENGLVDESDEPVNTGFSMTEQDLEVRPTEAELQRAWESAPARRVSVHCVVRAGKRFDVQPVIEPIVTINGAMAYIGPLVFRRGELVRWGRTERGRPLEPVEQLRAAKGSRKKPPARDLRFLVQTDAPIVKNAGFMSGATASTGRSGAPAECFAEAAQARKAEQSHLRAVLGAHAEILDLAISDSTAREIGESRGYKGKHAERRGIFLINEAFAALRVLVGESILPKAV